MLYRTKYANTNAVGICTIMLYHMIMYKECYHSIHPSAYIDHIKKHFKIPSMYIYAFKNNAIWII
jgi:hypothetical protein